MKPILEINQIRSSDENLMSFRVTITQGAEIITTEDILLNELIGTIPHNKGIVDISRLSNDIWVIKTNK